MTRRQHVVRTDDSGGAGIARSIGGCEILCAVDDCGNVNGGDSVQPELLARIRITSTRDYRRCFATATVGRINVNEGGMVVELYREDVGDVISSTRVPDGKPACLSGVVDLPEGESTLCIRMYPEDFASSGSYDGARMQVVVGQPVDEPGCVSQQVGDVG